MSGKMKHAKRSKRNSHNTFKEPVFSRDYFGMMGFLYNRKLKVGK